MAFNSPIRAAQQTHNGYGKTKNTIKSDESKNINSINGFKKFDLETQFKAAVDAIQNLPKNGPFQPSNEMLLKFYSHYKQATVGSPKKGRPSIFNVVERAKWDAWNSLAKFSKSEAMQGYVNEIKNIIETMPHDKYVQKLTEVLEPSYEYPKENENEENIEEITNGINNDHSDSDDLEHIYSNNGDNMEKKDILNDQIYPKSNKKLDDAFSLILPTTNGISTNWNSWASITQNHITETATIKKLSPIICLTNNINNFIPLENSSDRDDQNILLRKKISNGNSVADSSLPSYETEKNNISDDDDDYCDTSDEIIMNDTAVDSKERQGYNILIDKYGGDSNNPHSSIPNQSSTTNLQNLSSNVYNRGGSSRPGSSLSLGYSQRGASGGGPPGGGSGGFPPNENFTLQNISTNDTNRQILLILMRLQQDTNNVITRLSYLEATVLSLQNNMQMNRIESSIQLNNNNQNNQNNQNPKAVSAFTQFNSSNYTIDTNSVFGWFFNFLKSVDWKTVAMALVWPFIIRLAFYVLRKLKLFLKFRKAIRH